jgi:hypothetical protein
MPTSHDAGARHFAASDFEHLPQKCRGRSIRARSARPCPVEVLLVRQRVGLPAMLRFTCAKAFRRLYCSVIASIDGHSAARFSS